ncbi:hypothetical protein G5C51_31700 [Streptomyces sp. A7024]|uniref:Uncharacterized protein n=1 Tax=Streptomyces coryli TaxID=1128680 RepID=A0A6G4U888_9ACTN|nr:hypothetical protein [Streptomyces coryli]NGN68449.1 hypothetical protein [Streptomyces coryli]
MNELEVLRRQMALVVEFRVPVPDRGIGGYAEIVVRRERVDVDRWAVTDGAFTGLRAWVEGEGWQYVSDVGRAVAYAHGRDEALLLAHRVAELEAAAFEAEVNGRLQKEEAVAAIEPRHMLEYVREYNEGVTSSGDSDSGRGR